MLRLGVNGSLRPVHTEKKRKSLISSDCSLFFFAFLFAFAWSERVFIVDLDYLLQGPHKKDFCRPNFFLRKSELKFKKMAMHSQKNLIVDLNCLLLPCL